MNGLYKDDENKLWVVIHLDDGDLLEWGEDLSQEFGLPQYTIISSGNCDFLDTSYINEMSRIKKVEYTCVHFDYDCYDYIYVDENKFTNWVMENFKKIKDYENLVKFIRKYSGLICAVGE